MDVYLLLTQQNHTIIQPYTQRTGLLHDHVCCMISTALAVPGIGALMGIHQPVGDFVRG